MCWSRVVVDDVDKIFTSLISIAKLCRDKSSFEGNLGQLLVRDRLKRCFSRQQGQEEWKFQVRSLRLSFSGAALSFTDRSPSTTSFELQTSTSLVFSTFSFNLEPP